MARPHKMFTLNDEQRALIEDNIMLFYKCFHKLKDKYQSLSHDDIWDCCTEAAVKVAHDLDEKKGKYSTLLFIAAERNVLKQIRYYDFECRKGTKENISLDYDYSSGDGNGDEFLERYVGLTDDYEFINTELLSKMFAVLTKREKEVMYKFIFLEMNRSEIAKEEGISQQSVGRHVISAKEKMKKEYEL